MKDGRFSYAIKIIFGIFYSTVLLYITIISK